MANVGGLTGDYNSPYYRHAKRIVNSEGHSFPPIAASIQEALDDAGANGKVWLPKMDVSVTDLLMYEGQSVFGIGDGTILRQADTTGADPEARIWYPQVDSVEIAWMQLVGNDVTGDGIQAEGSYHKLHHLYIRNTGEEGIACYSFARGQIYNNRIHDFGEKVGSDGVTLATNSDYNKITDNIIVNGDDNAIHITSGSFNECRGNIIITPANYGYNIEDVENKIMGGVVYQPVGAFGHAVQAQAADLEVVGVLMIGNDVVNSVGVACSADRITVEACRIRDFDHGVHLLDADECVIVGGRIRGCVTRGVTEAGTSDFTLLDSINLRGNAATHDVNAVNSIVGDGVME